MNRKIMIVKNLMPFKFGLALWGCCLVALVDCGPAGAADYHVGPGQSYTAIGAVPWETISAGDRVYIHWREQPYYEKWVIGTSGTEAAPILVSGVVGPSGQLPVISGDNATTRQQLSYWNESRGLLKIGGTSIPADILPAYIIVENLDLRSARPPYTFTDDSGSITTYSDNSASFYIEKGQHITVRNCEIHDSGNGIFIGVNDGQTQDILIEGNYIHDNGIEGSIYQHNTYTAALGITYQFNRMGGLRSGAGGNNLKDRSAGLVVRYNWIENGNRQLDLVDGEDSSAVVADSRYHSTHVYGNVLKEADGEGNSQIIHYGGDSGITAGYRKGILYFYNNTVISTRTGNTTLMRLSTNDESAIAFNNIIYPTADGSYLALLGSSGNLTLQNNWLKSGWKVSHDSFSGTFTDAGDNINGTTPNFVDFGVDDYHLSESSAAINNGRSVPAELLDDYKVNYQYVAEQQGEARPVVGTIDIGAFERKVGIPGDFNGNGAIDPGDAILTLQVLGGMSVSLSLDSSTDIGADMTVTMEDALYILQYLGAGQ